MFQKSRILAVAALAAGTVGLCASAAYAGTFTGASGDNGGLVNTSHNQTATQACGNQIPTNVGGVQTATDRVAAALGLLATGPVSAVETSGCQQQNTQANSPAPQSQSASYSMSGDGWGWNYTGPSGDNGGLVNVSHNQTPVQFCNNDIPGNFLGAQVPVDQVAGALGILSTESFTAAQSSTCKQGSGQDNN